MAQASFKNIQDLINDLSPRQKVFHHPERCRSIPPGEIKVSRADLLDFDAEDEIVCTGMDCNYGMGLHWFMTEQYIDYIQDCFTVGNPSGCECGSAKIGIQPYRPGHSHWCPVTAK